MKRLFLLFACVLGFAACSTVQSMQQAVNCRYSLLSADVTDFSLKDIDLDVKVGITNASKTQAAKLNRFAGKLYINDDEVSTITFGAYDIAPASTETAKASLNLPFTAISKNIIGLVTANSAAVKYKIKGTMYFATPIGELPFPVVIEPKKDK